MYTYMNIYINVEVFFLQHDYIQVPIYRYYKLLLIHSISPVFILFFSLLCFSFLSCIALYT